MSTTEIECARLILETFPHAMRTLAHDMRDVPQGLGTVPQYRILAYLHHHGHDTMGRLAERHNVTMPTMTKIVAGLVDKGLVERETDSRDRRVVRLRLTDSGDSLFMDLRARMEARLANLMASMNDEERAALSCGLRAFQRAIYSAASDNVPAPETNAPL